MSIKCHQTSEHHDVALTLLACMPDVPLRAVSQYFTQYLHASDSLAPTNRARLPSYSLASYYLRSSHVIRECIVSVGARSLI
jgi:hypothetical protein